MSQKKLFTFIFLFFFIAQIADYSRAFAFSISCQESLTSLNINKRQIVLTTRDRAETVLALKNAESVTALVQAIFDDAGYNFSSDLFKKYLNSVSAPDGKIRSDQLESAISNLVLAKKYPLKVRRLYSDLKFNSNLENRLEAEIYIKGITEALNNYGIEVRNPSGFERVTHKLGSKILSTAFFIVGLKFGLISAIPSTLSVLNSFYAPARLNISDELFRSAEANGLAKSKIDIMRSLSLGNKFNIFWSQLRAVSSVITMAVILSFAVARPHIVFMPIERIFLTDLAVQNAKVKLFSSPQTEREERQRIFDSWRESFQVLYGRQPDPVVDKNDWERNWNSAFNTQIETLTGQPAISSPR